MTNPKLRFATGLTGVAIASVFVVSCLALGIPEPLSGDNGQMEFLLVLVINTAMILMPYSYMALITKKSFGMSLAASGLMVLFLFVAASLGLTLLLYLGFSLTGFLLMHGLLAVVLLIMRDAFSENGEHELGMVQRLCDHPEERREQIIHLLQEIEQNLAQRSELERAEALQTVGRLRREVGNMSTGRAERHPQLFPRLWTVAHDIRLTMRSGSGRSWSEALASARAVADMMRHAG